MKISILQAQEFMTFFSGSQHNYGEHIYGEVNSEGKRTGSSKTITNNLITIENYKDHLNGKKGLGIIPLNEVNKCKFAVIDIDIYNKDLNLYIMSIEKLKLPLIPFKSKSGGLHLYVFLKEETPAIPVINLLRRVAFLLSIDTLVKKEKNSVVEIFPKQTKLLKGDIGSWINLPYYNAEQPISYAIKDNNILSLNEALAYIKEKQKIQN